MDGDSEEKRPRKFSKISMAQRKNFIDAVQKGKMSIRGVNSLLIIGGDEMSIKLFDGEGYSSKLRVVEEVCG